MNKKAEKVFKKYVDLFSGNKKAALLVLAGAAAVLLLALSELFTVPKSVANTEIDTDFEYISEEEYTAALEKRLFEIVNSIDGVGNARVMITLECGTEYVFLQREESAKSTQQNGESYSYEYTPVIINDDSGEDGLITKIRQPVINGVVIVCAGADDPTVRARVNDAVTTLFDISSAKVSIVKMS